MSNRNNADGAGAVEGTRQDSRHSSKHKQIRRGSNPTTSAGSRRMLRLLFAAVGVVVVLGVAQFAPGVTATAHAHSTGGHTDRREPYTKWKLRELREEVREMFHHGWDKYMLHAFPHDEIKPLSCQPLSRTRPPEPLNLGLNDVLGNFSLTAIDTLSTLAILAETSPADRLRFWRAVEELRVRFYPDDDDDDEGVPDRRRRKRRSMGRGRGFDIDSRVQVFEATIRALGGLLSAHLYAVGEFGGTVFPVPETLEVGLQEEEEGGDSRWFGRSGKGVRVTGEFSYDGWLLDLAYDLGVRMLPAFEESEGGVPFPRVNLRWGLQHPEGRRKGKKGWRYQYVREGRYFNESEFYHQRPEENDGGEGVPPTEEEPDTITATCPAGAGSLVLEFTVLSRLTGDGRFEEVAKRAFDAVWRMRSGLGLLGVELDVDGSGEWMQYYSGIGAGIDSFFEYALKAYILLSPAPEPTFPHEPHPENIPGAKHPQPTIFSPEYFLEVWTRSRKAIERHLLRTHPTPHYLNVHLNTGAAVLSWIDSLSAFYPGLLTLSGHVADAEGAHLLYTALWARYHAIPERWNVRTENIDSGLTWWPGRPEFIESTYFLHGATGDEWYLRIGEMVLRDVQRRCYGACGWAGLQDVDGDAAGGAAAADRMESFFLGETAQYLYMLFDQGGALQRDEGSWVFTTEGHPLIIPKSTYAHQTKKKMESQSTTPPTHAQPPPPVCENPRSGGGTRHSSMATHPNLFHAFHFTHAYPPPATLFAPSDPHPHPLLTTPPTLLSPANPTCAPIPDPYKYAFDLLFPSPSPSPSPASPSSSSSSTSSTTGNKPPGPHRNFQRVAGGVFIHSLGDLRLSFLAEDGPGGLATEVRIAKVNYVGLGRDEKVFFPESLLGEVGFGGGGDENFGVREERGGERVDVVLEWVDGDGDGNGGGGDSGAGGEVLVENVEDEDEFETVEELAEQYRLLGEEVERLLDDAEGVLVDAEGVLGEKKSGAAAAPKERDGFWTTSAGGLVDQMRGLQRELEKLFDLEPSSAGSNPQMEHQQQKQQQKHHHQQNQPPRITIYPALLAAGPGAQPIPPPPPPPASPRLAWTRRAKPETQPQPQPPTWPPPPPPVYYTRIYIPTHTGPPSPTSPAYACSGPLPGMPAGTEVVFLLRGHCRFSEKVANVPDVGTVRIVVFVDEIPESEGGEGGGLTRPFLDEEQVRMRGGVAVVMVRGRGLWERLGGGSGSGSGSGKGGVRVAGVSVLRRWEVVVGPGMERSELGDVVGGRRVRNARVVRG